MRVRTSAVVACAAVITGAALWMRAQVTVAPDLPSLMPPGALLYVEAKDFHTLLSRWDSSSEKSKWLGSANFTQLAQSRLVQRLAEAQTQFASVAGLSVEMNLLDQVAGTRSAFAFYNLSKLSFVYLTQLPRPANPLWQKRTQYQSREVAGIPFYVKSDAGTDRSIAFASYKDWFIITTAEDRMADTLVLLSGQKAASLATEDWFKSTIGHSQTPGDLRLVYNLDALLQTPQFRTYWIHRNASELRAFHAGVADLTEHNEGFTEERALVRKTDTESPSEDAALEEALHWIPAQSSLYRAWAAPNTDQIAQALEEVVLSERPPEAVNNRFAPMVSAETAAVGTEADLETRIDEAPFHRASDESVAGLVNAIAKMQPRALLHVQRTAVLNDNVFVMPDSGAVIICKQPDAAALLVSSRSSLDPLRITVAGNALLITRLDLARSNSAPHSLPRTGFVAQYSNHLEWPHYKKLFDVLDRGAVNPETPVPGGTPSFFSQNLQSLGEAMSRLQSVSLTRRDEPSVVRETLHYEMARP